MWDNVIDKIKFFLKFNSALESWELNLKYFNFSPLCPVILSINIMSYNHTTIIYRATLICMSYLTIDDYHGKVLKYNIKNTSLKP